MKATFQFVLILLLFSLNSFSQTTQEEYNYLSKGYKIQIDSGLDMKKGYELISFSISTIGSYKFEFKKMIKINTNTLSGILVIAKSNISGNTYYFCIPNDNPQLLEKYYTEISGLDEPMTTALAVATANAINK